MTDNSHTREASSQSCSFRTRQDRHESNTNDPNETKDRTVGVQGKTLMFRPESWRIHITGVTSILSAGCRQSASEASGACVGFFSKYLVYEWMDTGHCDGQVTGPG